MTTEGPTSIWDSSIRPATIALITTIALSAFEGLAIAAAIPEITAELGQVALTAWILTGYFVASTVATLAAGPIVDQRGVRWTFEVSSNSGPGSTQPNPRCGVRCRLSVPPLLRCSYRRSAGQECSGSTFRSAYAR